jgi:hypothetical protein
VATHNTEEFIYDHVDGHLREMGLAPEANVRELVDAVMGYTGRGYAQSTQEELGNVVNSYTCTVISTKFMRPGFKKWGE